MPVLGALSCYGRNHPRAARLWESACHREKPHASPAVQVSPVQTPTRECKSPRDVPASGSWVPSPPPPTCWGPRHHQADSSPSPRVRFRDSWPTGSTSLIKPALFFSTKFGVLCSAAVVTRTLVRIVHELVQHQDFPHWPVMCVDSFYSPRDLNTNNHRIAADSPCSSRSQKACLLFPALSLKRFATSRTKISARSFTFYQHPFTFMI